MSRQHQDPWHVATTKLAQDWSANRGVPHITPEFLEALLPDERFATMDSAVKVRLLLAGLLALDAAPSGAAAAAPPTQQRAQQAALRAEVEGPLGRLRAAVAGDADEWSKVMAAAAGQLDGRLDWEAVVRQSAEVQKNMSSLTDLVQASSNADIMPPLEDLFLHKPPSVLRPGAGHFVVRQSPAVQPLSGGFMYTQATPPPPSLQAQGVYSAGAAQPAAAAPFLRQGQARQQAAAPKAPGGAAPGGPLGRLKAAHPAPERQHSVQLLGAEDASSLFKNTTLKHGHGVASAVRHEQLAYEKRPPRPKPAQQAPASRLQQQQQQEEEQQEQQRGGATADASGQQAGSDEVDALFEDSEDDDADWQDVQQAPAAASLGQQAAQGQAAAAAGVMDDAAHDVMDDMADDDFDDQQQQQQQERRRQGQGQQRQRPCALEDDDDDEGGDGAEGEAHQQQQQQQQAAGQARSRAAPAVTLKGAGGLASASAKRRRHVIADDSDDDD